MDNDCLLCGLTPEAYTGYNATMSLCHYVIVQINLFMRGMVFVTVIVIEEVYGAFLFARLCQARGSVPRLRCFRCISK